jgi:hypothetical protein
MKTLFIIIIAIIFLTSCGKLTKEQCAKKGLTWVKVKTVDKQTNQFIYKGFCEKKQFNGYL